MSSGTSDSPVTNKTEFQRFVDQKPESVPPFAKRLTEFRKVSRHDHFGAWMRSKHLEEFSWVYKTWWLIRPELFGEIYKETPQDLLSSK
jgi:hypothetical protein